MEEYRSARDLFEAARDAYRERARATDRLRAMEAAEGIRGGRVTAGGRAFDPGAPTPTDRRIDEEERTRRAIAECDELLDFANEVVYGADRLGGGGVYALLGHAEADVLDLHWCQDVTWEDTASKVGFSKAWCTRAARRSFDLIDGYGVKSVIQGRGRAEL